MQEKYIISAIVNNHFGVLTRVSSLFSRRGYNIDSLVVGTTDDPNFSRMTITATCDEYIKEQMVKQLYKLHDVIKVDSLPSDDSVIREHMLVKLRVENGANAQITDIIDKFGAKVIDFSPETITAEVTSEVENNDRFIQAVTPYGIMEICRAGAQALRRGNKTL